jgi:hypothetical protein
MQTALVGRPDLPIHQLDTLLHDALALVPHRSRRGPNGIWILRRGPEHEMVRQFERCRAFYVTRDGKPDSFEDVTHSSHDPANGIELYLDLDEAQERAEDARGFYPDDAHIEVASTSGIGLLQLLAGRDLVLVDGEAFALSHAGEHALRAGGDADAGVADTVALTASLRQVNEA